MVVKTSQNSSVNVVSSCMAKSEEHIIWVFWMLSSNIDNKEADEPVSLKKAMARYD